MKGHGKPNLTRLRDDMVKIFRPKTKGRGACAPDPKTKLPVSRVARRKCQGTESQASNGRRSNRSTRPFQGKEWPADGDGPNSVLADEILESREKNRRVSRAWSAEAPEEDRRSPRRKLAKVQKRPVRRRSEGLEIRNNKAASRSESSKAAEGKTAEASQGRYHARGKIQRGPTPAMAEVQNGFAR